MMPRYHAVVLALATLLLALVSAKPTQGLVNGQATQALRAVQSVKAPATKVPTRRPHRTKNPTKAPATTKPSRPHHHPGTPVKSTSGKPA